MIKIVKSTIKYLLFFALGAIVAAVVGVTGISYYAVDQLAKATAPTPEPKKNKKKEKKVAPEDEQTLAKNKDVNPNFKEVVKISLNYEQELALIDRLAKDVQKHKVPKICTTLCNPIALDSERLKEERSEYLFSYYQQEGRRALEDPLFLLKLEEMQFLSRMFPPSLRELLKQIEQLQQQPDIEKQKWLLATKGQVTVYRELANFYSVKDSFSKDEKRIQLLRDLIKRCQHGESPKKIIKECQDRTTN